MNATRIRRNAEQDSGSAPVYGADVSTRRAQRGEIGRRIDAALEVRGWSIQRLCNESGVPRSTMNDILRGVSRQPQRLREIAAALGVPYDALDPEPGVITADQVEAAFLESPLAAALDPPYGPTDRAFIERLGPTVWQGEIPSPRVIFRAIEWGREVKPG